jgi:tripartite-type tricarboxylate transporter receptor subunit TctC
MGRAGKPRQTRPGAAKLLQKGEEIVVKLTRRFVVLGGAAAPLAAGAQTWPAGLIRIVAPFPAGGSVDAIARLAQPGLQQRLGVSVLVENRAGGSGSIGAASVAKSPPDGHTWLIVFDTHAVNPSLIPNLPFDSRKDLEPVALIGTAPNVLATHPSRPWKSLADVIAAARAKPDSISYATIGAGSLGHLTMVLLGQRAGAKFVHVPYRGGGPAMNDAIGGHVDLIIGSAALVSPQLEAGKLRPLVQTGATRQATLPDIPTAIESGFPGFESLAWWGVFAPAGTPKAIIDRFREALTASLREERIARQLTESQQVSLRLDGPEAFRAFFEEQMRIWGAVVRDNGIKAET